MIVIKKNPKKDVYKALIDMAIDVCDEFQIILRKDLGPVTTFDPVMKRLEHSFKEMKEESEWASTILGDNQTACVHYFYADENARHALKDLSNSLYGWVYPDLPEDLSFFSSGKEWLVTSSHEKESYIHTENPIEIAKISRIKGLKFRIETEQTFK
ncbi:stage III sporulation protein AH [Vibrio vulnificus]|nr:stage III sporulation protein AH [Vibrio vulnificus]